MGKYKKVDDTPYGGGVGMVMRIDVVDAALQSFKPKAQSSKPKVILLTPQGKLFNQKKAYSLSQYSNLLLICGHYEGFDERIRELVDFEISIGDYILTGGEIPAMILVDSISRLIPGVLGKEESLKEESFTKKAHGLRLKAQSLLEYPQYTRPEKYKKWKVPKILLSGNHQKIADWRLGQAIKRTKKRRPDLLE